MKAHTFQMLFSNCIIFLLLTLCMIASIHFDDKAFTLRDEINDVITYNILPVESSSNVQCMQFFPQNGFRKGHITTILSCKILQERISVR